MNRRYTLSKLGLLSLKNLSEKAGVSQKGPVFELLADVSSKDDSYALLEMLHFFLFLYSLGVIPTQRLKALAKLDALTYVNS